MRPAISDRTMTDSSERSVPTARTVPANGPISARAISTGTPPGGPFLAAPGVAGCVLAGPDLAASAEGEPARVPPGARSSPRNAQAASPASAITPMIASTRGEIGGIVITSPFGVVFFGAANRQGPRTKPLAKSLIAAG